MHPSAREAHPTPHPSEFSLPAGALWVFGYGSLMWDPGFPYVQRSRALVYGFHRELCVYSTRWRGTAERPGLVLGLAPGGACRGVAYQVAADEADAVLAGLWAREMRRRAYEPRMLRARLGNRDVHALGFIANVAHPAYTGHLSIEDRALLVATCCGDRGSNVDYLKRTIVHLSELGVRDRDLLAILDAALGTDPAEALAGNDRTSASGRKPKE